MAAQGVEDLPAKVLDARDSNLLSLFLRAGSLYPVYRRLVTLLTPAEIITLSWTCKSLSGLYKDLLETDWNINRALKRFTGNPKRFRSVLTQNHAAISGSFALDFFDRNVTESSQIEIVVGVYRSDRTIAKGFVEWDWTDREMEIPGVIRHHDCKNIYDFLVEEEGFQLYDDDQADDDAIFHRQESRVDWLIETFKHPVSGVRIKLASPYLWRPRTQANPRPRPGPETEPVQVNRYRRRRQSEYGIIEPANAECLNHLLNEFATTAGANFVLGDRAVSLFPLLTYTMRLAYSTSEAVYMDLDYGKCAQPLLRRDISPRVHFFPNIWSSSKHCRHDELGEVASNIWGSQERRILGPNSWVIPLDTEGVAASTVDEAVLQTACFSLWVKSHLLDVTDVNSGSPRGQRLEIDATNFSCPSLKHVYCLAALGGAHEDPRPELTCLSGYMVENAERAWLLNGHALTERARAAVETDRLASIWYTERGAILAITKGLPDGWFRDCDVPTWLESYQSKARTSGDVVIQPSGDDTRLLRTIAADVHQNQIEFRQRLRRLKMQVPGMTYRWPG